MIRKLIPYVLVVAVTAGGSYLVNKAVLDDTVHEVATISYYNAVDACFRGNDTIRRPARDFMVAFIKGERDEPDDPNEVDAARDARKAFVQLKCLSLIEKVGPADDYLFPEQR